MKTIAADSIQMGDVIEVSLGSKPPRPFYVFTPPRFAPGAMTATFVIVDESQKPPRAFHVQAQRGQLFDLIKP